MAEQASIVQDGIDRFSSTFDSLGDEVERLQKRIKTRRKSFEKQFNDQRKSFEKQTRKQVGKLENEIRKSSFGKQLREFRSDAFKRLEQGVDRVLENLPIATTRDVNRIERKLTQISKKVKELERMRRANGESTPI